MEPLKVGDLCITLRESISKTVLSGTQVEIVRFDLGRYFNKGERTYPHYPRLYANETL